MTSTVGHYIGRFAPSPTGPLHAGSLVAALASWLDARAHGGQWIVRMEDVDVPRCIADMDAVILNQLAAFGLVSDSPVVYQSVRTDLYESALQTLIATQQVFRCYCSRKGIALTSQDGIYTGTCRKASLVLPSQKAWPQGQYAYRLRASDQLTVWQDRKLGVQTQNVGTEVGDFVVKRADGRFAYQLAVVVDDANQGITHIVRGEDLADNTARQIALQMALGLTQPQYLHVPLVLASDGLKLSKQNGAQALDITNLLAELNTAAAQLGLYVSPDLAQRPIGESLMAWTLAWSQATASARRAI